jgi:hypothetical protein
MKIKYIYKKEIYCIEIMYSMFKDTLQICSFNQFE